MTARLLSCTMEQYHADLVGDEITLSPSQAHILISKSPAHLWLEHPRLGNQPRQISDEKRKKMEEGSLLHKMILGAGKEYQVIFGVDDYKTNMARELRDSIRANRMIPVLESTFDKAVFAYERIKQQLDERGIVFSGKSEMMMSYKEMIDDGYLVNVRMMPDHFIYDQAEIIELKSTFCAHPQICERQIGSMGYDIQMYAYLCGVAALHPELAGRLQFTWIFFESEPPYSITIGQPDGVLREIGGRLWKRAINTWHHCLKTNTWPQYTEGVILMTAPMWRLKEEIGEGEFL